MWINHSIFRGVVPTKYDSMKNSLQQNSSSDWCFFFPYSLNVCQLSFEKKVALGLPYCALWITKRQCNVFCGAGTSQSLSLPFTFPIASQLLSLTAVQTLFVNTLPTAARINFVKRKSDIVSSLLRTCQWHTMARACFPRLISCSLKHSSL